MKGLSFEYREFHGADPEKFFKDTMRKNVRDRNILFEFESELINFIQNENCQVKEFPGMCSYYRMLLHRVSAYFGLEHNVIAGGTSLAVKKTPNTRIPPVSFQSLYNECMEKPTSTLATTTTTLTTTTTITTSVATAITTSTTNVPVLLKREAEVGKENGSNTMFCFFFRNSTDSAKLNPSGNCLYIVPHTVIEYILMGEKSKRPMQT
ncbi:putative cAMP-regulated phosphoprotein 21 [Trichinella spiralis]|uniref:putative cAMP-regulated phosphoprotein 21 n=1 Tax=Trichinella spiralis TaxID=6334 RepID=UPI0001EFB2E7|nr:putative cAMP-regulated phosphoprotein 21 [Trichinella spiralis]